MAITMSLTSAGSATAITRNTVHAAHIPEATMKFYAPVSGDSAGGAVMWGISQGGGQIDSMGVFYPPVTAGKSTIVATAKGDPKAKMWFTVSY